MDENTQNQAPTPSGPSTDPVDQGPKKSSSMGMWIGLIVVIVLVVAAYFIFFN
jgi:flagellar basal body-associated protein FliL